MKRLLTYLFLALGFILIALPANSGPIGMGELKLSDRTVGTFIKYLKGGWGNKPLIFVVTIDGAGADYWYCPESTCEPGNSKRVVKVCKDYWKKECKVFAKSRTVKWKNDINPGKGKASKFDSKWSDTKIRERLKELGFL